MERSVSSVEEFLFENNLSRSSFYREVDAGRLKILKRGSRTFVEKHEREAWLEILRQESKKNQNRLLTQEGIRHAS